MTIVGGVAPRLESTGVREWGKGLANAEGWREGDSGRGRCEVLLVKWLSSDGSDGLGDGGRYVESGRPSVC